MNMQELMTCPHCNGSGRIVSVSGFKSDRYRVVCEQCGASTRECETEKEAVSAWNMRADGWISVKERLPNVAETGGLYEECLVIATDGFASRFLIYERATIRGKVVYRWKWYWDRIYDGAPIVAWQPIPEPKKEEK